MKGLFNFEGEDIYFYSLDGSISLENKDFSADKIKDLFKAINQQCFGNSRFSAEEFIVQFLKRQVITKEIIKCLRKSGIIINNSNYKRIYDNPRNQIHGTKRVIDKLTNNLFRVENVEGETYVYGYLVKYINIEPSIYVTLSNLIFAREIDKEREKDLFKFKISDTKYISFDNKNVIDVGLFNNKTLNLVEHNSKLWRKNQ